MQTNWVILDGKVEFVDSKIQFDGGQEKPQKQSKLTASLPFYSRLKSNIYFQSGDIKTEVFIEDQDTKIQFILQGSGNKEYYIGLNPQNHAYGIVERADYKFSSVSVAGDSIKPQINKWLEIEIKVRGSQIELFIENVSVSTTQASLIRSQVELVIQGNGKAVIKNLAIKPVSPIVFVVMQFTEEFDALYQNVIAPICIEYGYTVVRADDIYTNGLIIEDIARSIKESSLVIADITPNNANVFYEVGYAHGINKTTILLSDRKREKLPFDISGFRLLFYDNTIGGKPAVEKALRKHLDSITL